MQAAENKPEKDELRNVIGQTVTERELKEQRRRFAIKMANYVLAILGCCIMIIAGLDYSRVKIVKVAVVDNYREGGLDPKYPVQWFHYALKFGAKDSIETISESDSGIRITTFWTQPFGLASDGLCEHLPTEASDIQLSEPLGKELRFAEKHNQDSFIRMDEGGKCAYYRLWTSGKRFTIRYANRTMDSLWGKYTLDNAHGHDRKGWAVIYGMPGGWWNRDTLFVPGQSNIAFGNGVFQSKEENP